MPAPLAHAEVKGESITHAVLTELRGLRKDGGPPTGRPHAGSPCTHREPCRETPAQPGDSGEVWETWPPPSGLSSLQSSSRPGADEGAQSGPPEPALPLGASACRTCMVGPVPWPGAQQQLLPCQQGRGGVGEGLWGPGPGGHWVGTQWPVGSGTGPVHTPATGPPPRHPRAFQAWMEGWVGRGPLPCAGPHCVLAPPSSPLPPRSLGGSRGSALTGVLGRRLRVLALRPSALLTLSTPCSADSSSLAPTCPRPRSRASALLRGRRPHKGRPFLLPHRAPRAGPGLLGDLAPLRRPLVLQGSGSREKAAETSGPEPAGGAPPRAGGQAEAGCRPDPGGRRARGPLPLATKVAATVLCSGRPSGRFSQEGTR